MKWIVGALAAIFVLGSSYFLHDTSDRTASSNRAKLLRRKSTNWASASPKRANTRPSPRSSA